MILPKEEFKKRAMLVGNKNYLQLFPWFVRLLKRTRLPYLKHNGFWMGATQMNMIRALFKLQKEMRQVKIELVRATAEGKKKEIEQKLLIYTEWIRVIQTIADGIAWRNLRFNRPLIRLCSENKSSGHLNENDVKVFFRYLSKMSNFVIANDLTRCLRISDLTQILSDGRIFLYEIKKSGSRLQDVNYILEHMRRQKKLDDPQKLRQLVVQLAIADKKITVPMYKDGKIQEQLKAEIIDLDFRIKTHFSIIKKLIKKADKKGYAQAELEQGYFVEVIPYDKIIKKPNLTSHFQYRKEQFDKYAPEWLKNKKDKITTISNYESFLQESGHYTRNFLPYSVIPFSAKDCVRLIMGCFHLKIYYNLSILEERIREMGWTIEKKEKSLSYLNKQKIMARKEYEEPGNFYKYDLDEVLYYLSKKDENGTYHTTILSTQIFIMLSSMYETRFLIDEINLLYSQAKIDKSKGRTITINFLGEQKVLV